MKVKQQLTQNQINQTAAMFNPELLVKPTVETPPTVVNKGKVWKLHLTSHTMKKVDYAFEGSFADCMNFVGLLEDVKPSPKIGAIILDRVTSPFELFLEGPGVKFKITNRSNVRSTEISFL